MNTIETMMAAEAIELTAGVVVERIGALQDLLKGLRELQNGEAPSGRAQIPSTKHQAPEKIQDPRSKKTTKRSPAKAVGGASGPYLEFQGKVARLAEPFGALEIAKAVGTNRRNAGNAVTRWSANGWITRVGFGKYERTKLFGGTAKEAPNTKHQHPEKHQAPSSKDQAPKEEDGNGSESLGELRERLANACAERDKHRGMGREKLAESYQNKVDRLEEQIGALE